MKKKPATGLWMIGRYPQSGVTVYEKQGEKSFTFGAQQNKAESLHAETVRTTSAYEAFYCVVAYTFVV